MAIPRLSAFEQMFLRLETPEWPCHYGGLALVDGAPLLDDAGRLRLSHVRARLARRLVRAPALRQRLELPGPGRGRPLWVDDPAFDIAHHVGEVAVPDPGDDAALLATAADLCVPLLDRRRP
ncbi:wax ester/triacylglycerol synthase domain-containing protein [Euzebya sp.]|uniref:wax ester/triacylglycerol synthase domain-containing protein n=1 Tax=Euzebya sp. TaxID=1971409 RepID=UPI0035181701